MMKKLGQRGFSLAEIIVVLVIVGVLTAIALPSFQGFLKESKANSAQNQLISLYAAQKIYLKKTGKYYYGDLTLPIAETCLGTKINVQGIYSALCTPFDATVVPDVNVSTGCNEALDISGKPPVCYIILKYSANNPHGQSTMQVYVDQPITLTNNFQAALGARNPRCFNSGAGIKECPP